MDDEIEPRKSRFYALVVLTIGASVWTFHDAIVNPDIGRLIGLYSGVILGGILTWVEYERLKGGIPESPEEKHDVSGVDD